MRKLDDIRRTGRGNRRSVLGKIANARKRCRDEIDPFDQLEKAMGVGRRYPNVQIPQNFVLLGRVFAALGGLVLRYRPRVNMAQMVLPYLGVAMAG